MLLQFKQCLISKETNKYMKYQTAVPHLDLFNSPSRRCKPLKSPRLSDRQPYFSPDLTSPRYFESKAKPNLYSTRSLQKFNPYWHQTAEKQAISKAIPMCEQNILYPSGYHLNIPFSTNYLDYEPEVMKNNPNNRQYGNLEYWSRAQKDQQQKQRGRIQKYNYVENSEKMEKHNTQNQRYPKILQTNQNYLENSDAYENAIKKIKQQQRQKYIIKQEEQKRQGYTKTMSEAILDEILKQQEIKKYQQKYNSENKFSQVIVGKIEKKTQIQNFKRYTQQQQQQKQSQNIQDDHIFYENTNNAYKNLLESRENKENWQQKLDNSHSEQWVINRSNITQQQRNNNKPQIIKYNKKTKQEENQNYEQHNQQIISDKYTQITCNHERQMQRFLKFLEDDKSFRKKINEKSQEFNRITIDLEDSQSFSINSLIRQKDQIVSQTNQYINRIDYLLRQQIKKPKERPIYNLSPADISQMPIQHKVISLQRLSPRSPPQLQQKNIYAHQNWKPVNILPPSYAQSNERPRRLEYHPIPTNVTEHIIFQRTGS